MEQLEEPDDSDVCVKIKRLTIITVIVCVLILGGLAYSLRPSAEPRYRDISLSTWLALHRSYQFRHISRVTLIVEFREVPGRDTLGPDAANAIKQVGTNALPALITWMRQPECVWKRKLFEMTQKFPSAMRPKKLPAWLDYRRDHERASLALTGFGILKTEAAPAIPALARIACDTNALGTARAVGILVQIGKPAVPALTGLLSANTPRPTRVAAFDGLGYLGSNAADAVPAIVSCLASPDEGIAKSAAWALGRIACRSEIAIPALVKCLDDSPYSVRLMAVKALGEFGGDAWPAIRSLRELVSQPDLELSGEAERTLLKISSASSGEPVGPEGRAFGEIFPGLR